MGIVWPDYYKIPSFWCSQQVSCTNMNFSTNRLSPHPKWKVTLNCKGFTKKKLEHDRINGPFHCFGQHEKCSSDFCQTSKEFISFLSKLFPSLPASAITTTCFPTLHQVFMKLFRTLLEHLMWSCSYAS